ncbi:hypothetical protein [Streptomyces sp. DG1A-41]|uniref:hypothetical protein n=1 Tax=Streptomyces sp. DG1A-41 TaxID=3125779 RepID=UPI0030D25541
MSAATSSGGSWCEANVSVAPYSSTGRRGIAEARISGRTSCGTPALSRVITVTPPPWCTARSSVGAITSRGTKPALISG